MRQIRYGLPSFMIVNQPVDRLIHNHLRYVMLRTLIALILISVTTICIADTENIKRLRMSSTLNSNRVVFDTSGPIQHKMFVLQNPQRVVVDMFDTQPGDSLPLLISPQGVIKKMRSAVRNKKNFRVVFDTKVAVESKSFILPPIGQYGHRLVVDIFAKYPKEISRRKNNSPIIKKPPSELIARIDADSKDRSDADVMLRDTRIMDRDSRGIEFDFDDPPNTTHQLTQTVSFGANFKIRYNLEHDFDLDSNNDDNQESLESSVDMAFSYKPIDWALAYIEVGLEREYLINHPDDTSNPKVKFEVSQAYFLAKNIIDNLSLQIGRQRFRDPREWWYDDKLDAIRLFYRTGNLGLELSASRKEIIGEDLLNDDNQNEINNYFLVSRYAYNQDIDFSLYLLFRDEHSKRQRDPIYLGVQSQGEIAPKLEYWIDMAALYGNNGDKNYRSYGLDIGTTFSPKLPFKPSLTVGLAMGSGDKNPDDDIDRTFRQTGLEDNSGKFNGVTRFKYYGELLDPELSNLWIWTAGIGFRPSKRSSLDLVYHYYRQSHLDDNLRGDIDVDPDQEHKEIGQEVDLIFAFRDFQDLSVKGVVGAFFLGNAFPDLSDNAYFGKIEFSFRY